MSEAFSGIPYEHRFNFGEFEVTVAPTDLLEICGRCRTEPDLHFDALMVITGVDHETSLELVYHLYSYRHHHHLTLRTTLEHYDAPSASSVTPMWPSANWHEREAAEMFGITFPGHPDPRPLLLDDDVQERPLRRSHALVPLYQDRPGVVTAPPTGPARQDS